MWWNWQTCWTQNPVLATGCGFDPRHRHHVVADYVSFATTFLLKSHRLTHAVTPPFRKKSRSAHLLSCKRPRDGSLSLPTFCGFKFTTSYGISFATCWHQAEPRRNLRSRFSFFLLPIHPRLWRASISSTLLSSCKRHIACDELFYFIAKPIVHSFCCSSVTNQTRCAGF